MKKNIGTRIAYPYTLRKVEEIFQWKCYFSRPAQDRNGIIRWYIYKNNLIDQMSESKYYLGENGDESIGLRVEIPDGFLTQEDVFTFICRYKIGDIFPSFCEMGAI